MANTLLTKLDNQSKNNTRLYIIGGIILFGIGISVWFNSLYLNPTNMFWDMFSNNLSTNGFTTSQKYFNGSYNINQKTQIALAGDNYAHTITTLSQVGASVTTEEINSPNYEYVKYLDISSNKKNAANKSINYTKDLNIWGYGKNYNNASQQIKETFYKTLFSILPLANLSTTQRNDLISYAKSHKVYTIDNKINKQTINGVHVDTLSVKVNRLGYIGMMELFAKDVNFLGLGNVSPKQYEKLPAITVQISIDPISRNLVKINSGSALNASSYSGFGVNPLYKLPTKTIDLQVLEARIRSKN